MHLAIEFVSQLPYKSNFVFGFVTLIDPNEEIKNKVFKEHNGIQRMLDGGLDNAENVVLDYLIKGRYFATTGTHTTYLWKIRAKGFEQEPNKRSVHKKPRSDIFPLLTN